MSIANLFRVPFSPALLFTEGVRLSRAAVRQVDSVFPGHTSQGKISSHVAPPRGAEMIPLRTRRDQRIKAIFSPAARPHAPTFLFFYGNDMCLRAAMPAFELLRSLGINVLVPEYVGFGLSDGKPSEANCYATADAAYEFLVNHQNIDPRTLVVGGCSLGGAVAIDLAYRRHVAGVATLVTFTSLREMARRFYPAFLVSLMLRWRFPSEEKIRRVKCPVLIGHSRTDKFVPFWMADRLAAAAAGPVSRLTLDNADHNSASVLATATGKIRHQLDEFIQMCQARALSAA